MAVKWQRSLSCCFHCDEGYCRHPRGSAGPSRRTKQQRQRLVRLAERGWGEPGSSEAGPARQGMACIRMLCREEGGTEEAWH